MDAKTRSLVATLVAFLGAVWHFHDISVVTARTPVGAFPFVPAGVTVVACVLALRWWDAWRRAAE